MARPKKTEEEKVKTPASSKKEKTFIGVGRRKSAVASVFMFPKKGDFLVNEQSIEDYFSSLRDKNAWLKPFHMVGVSHPNSTYSASIKVSGSGKSSQMDAVVLGISKALLNSNEEFRLILRKQGLLTRDSRRVERKKPYLRKARKAPQYSKR